MQVISGTGVTWLSLHHRGCSSADACRPPRAADATHHAPLHPLVCRCAEAGPKAAADVPQGACRAASLAVEDVGLFCWQRQCDAGCRGLNGSFQPRHTADLASISFPNGRS